jgi:dienelactone hydrolase
VLQILVRPALAELGAIIVAPDSLGGGWESAENERAVNQLLDAVLASYSIDTKKITITGFSMGGSGTWHVAAKFPQRFTAAIPMAGRLPVLRRSRPVWLNSLAPTPRTHSTPSDQTARSDDRLSGTCKL